MTMVERLALALAGLTLACPGATEKPWLGPVEALESPAGTGACFPHLAAGPEGRPALNWLEPAGGDAFALRHARWTGEAWSPANTIAQGSGWLVNWADFPALVHVRDRLWAAHWLQRRPGFPHAYDLRVVTSEDDGRTWSTPATPHDDDTPAEHGFLSLRGAGDTLHALWLDGRRTLTGGATALRHATLGADGERTGADLEIDPRVCDCCQTDAAVTAEGLVVVYRDRSPDEVRDIALVRQLADGWSPPILVHADNWTMPGCPVNGPAIAAHDRTVAVAWFTAPDQPRVRLAFSSDAGRSFAAPLEVATGGTIGRVDVLLRADALAIVSWVSDGPDGAAILAQPFRPTGPVGAAVTVARTSAARDAGFPRMQLAGEHRLLFAWTEATQPPRLRTASARLQ